ncbi:MAG TPA: cytosine permease [Candidatus Limnocylindrales bacterium]|jgi:NCS1 family nucleobase:cation symporter-1|nr:cytosine permease [Candidatus Limnocylindrales bacterium]
MTARLLTGEGMPSREGDLSIEGHGMEPIPGSARYGSVSRVFTVWFTPNLVPAAFFLGTLAAASFIGLGFWTSIAAIIVGNLVGSVLVGLLATMGPKTGMAQMPLARLAYGKSIVVPGLLNWLSCIGWDGINSVFGAAAISILTGLPFVVSLIVIVVCQGLLGILGYEAIHTFEKYMAIVLGAMFVILTVAIAGQAGTGIARTDAVAGADQVGSFILYSTIIASFVLAWALYASDYTRYLPESTPSSRVFWWTVLGLTLSAGWVEALGLLVADKATQGGAVDTINTILSGTPLAALAMLAIGIGTVAVNAMNDYTGSLSLQAAGIRVPRVYSAILVAILGFLVTLWLNAGDLVGKIENILLFLSYWIAPWAAVVLADWRLRRGRATVSRLVDFGGLPSGVLALASLIVGFIVSLPFQQSSVGEDLRKSTGLPINAISDDILHYADLAYIVGFVVAFGIFWIGARSMVSRSVEAGATTA